MLTLTTEGKVTLKKKAYRAVEIADDSENCREG